MERETRHASRWEAEARWEVVVGGEGSGVDESGMLARGSIRVRVGGLDDVVTKWVGVRAADVIGSLERGGG